MGDGGIVVSREARIQARPGEEIVDRNIIHHKF
jgi:hypothetical protein